MKIGLLITSIGNFGQRGFYNAQEIGMAKELDKYFEKVIVYKAIPFGYEASSRLIEGCEHAFLYQIPVKSKGINGIWDCSVMTNEIDALIYFSDTQLSVPNVYKWCLKEGIKMYPYIGVLESHSKNILKKIIIDKLFYRNLNIYKKCTCFVKTPTIQKKLMDKGIYDCIVAPVGLDVSLLYSNYKEVSIEELKKKWGYSAKEKVLLFIGRMTEEKQPKRMINIFKKVCEYDCNYRLLMIGKGELQTDVIALSEGLPVKFIDQIPNKDIWELYLISDAFVNLNNHEIFGMSILEAMYYNCKVIAWKAPGPDYIIENNLTGNLVDCDQDAVNCILDGKKYETHEVILNLFTWESTAKKIMNILYKGLH